MKKYEAGRAKGTTDLVVLAPPVLVASLMEELKQFYDQAGDDQCKWTLSSAKDSEEVNLEQVLFCFMDETSYIYPASSEGLLEDLRELTGLTDKIFSSHLTTLAIGVSNQRKLPEPILDTSTAPLRLVAFRDKTNDDGSFHWHIGKMEDLRELNDEK